MADQPNYDGTWPSVLLVGGMWCLHLAGTLSNVDEMLRFVLLVLQVFATIAALIVATPKAWDVLKKFKRHK